MKLRVLGRAMGATAANTGPTSVTYATAAVGSVAFAWLASRDFSHANPLFHPHGYCYLWLPNLVTAHVVADALISLSYLTISLTLVYLVRQTRREIPFSWMFLAFGAFIVACGATHAMEIVTLWTPLFWLSADVKIVTALASVLTAIALPPLVPRIVAMVTAAEVSETRRLALERAQHELDTDARRFSGLMEAAPDPMVILDRLGTLVLVNGQVERAFGYERGELLGQPIEMLLPDCVSGEQPNQPGGFFGHSNVSAMEPASAWSGRRCDGSEFPAEVSWSTVGSNSELLVMASIRDVTERKRLQHRLESSLEEKNLLLKEVHHRVRNNLAVMSSLFYLQSTYTQDQGLISAFEECQRRVRSMALVHERLYGSDSLADIDFGGYGRALAEELFSTYGASGGRVKLAIDAQAVRMSIDLAVPCALILNELVSNTLKHAFPGGASGLVTVSVKMLSDDRCLVQVSDDGVGVPTGLDVEAHNSLGLRLIKALVRQIGGAIDFVPGQPGTIARLTFALGDGHRGR